MVMAEFSADTCMQILLAAQTLTLPVHLPAPATPKQHHQQQQPQHVPSQFHQLLTTSKPGGQKLVFQTTHRCTNLASGYGP